jgi:hypothetical protein
MRGFSDKPTHLALTGDLGALQHDRCPQQQRENVFQSIPNSQKPFEGPQFRGLDQKPRFMVCLELSRPARTELLIYFEPDSTAYGC